MFKTKTKRKSKRQPRTHAGTIVIDGDGNYTYGGDIVNGGANYEQEIFDSYSDFKLGELVTRDKGVSQ